MVVSTITTPMDENRPTSHQRSWFRHEPSLPPANCLLFPIENPSLSLYSPQRMSNILYYVLFFFKGKGP